MEPRKQAIIAALDKFVRQRPGLDFRNYGDGPAYRSEQRSITRTLKDYRILERAVILNDSIGADELLAAASSAYSGRLNLAENWHQFMADECPGRPCGDGCDHRQFRGFIVEYCTGQYFPTEYRRAACTLLSAAIWGHVREHVMPEPTYVHHGSADDLPMSTERVYDGLPAGSWIRRHLYQTFGRSIAVRWFDWEPRDGK